MNDMNARNLNIERPSQNSFRKLISPAGHAVLDYGVAAAFIAYGFSVRSHHRAAATLAFVNGAMVLGMSMLTTIPVGGRVFCAFSTASDPWRSPWIPRNWPKVR